MTAATPSPSPSAATRWPRPTAHFTPTTGWMNDPNGLVRHGGRYHLYFQHNPDQPVWGDICWGHAVSTDLVHWEEWPIAIRPDDLGEIFSGSIVIDVDDTAGFGVGAIIAVFTHDLDGLQRQSIAVSTDGGRTFAKFDGNPVLLPGDRRDFRDPKVVRFGELGNQWWVMALAVGTEIWFYRSDDLREWGRTSTLRPDSPWSEAMIEVPDLVAIDDDGVVRWVLLYSVDPPDTAGPIARHVRWLVGSFDGERFEPSGGGVLDDGAHLYAAMTWSDGVEAPIVIGWMNEAEVAGRDATTPWCGRQTLARSLSVDDAGGVSALVQQPIGLDSLRLSTQRLLEIPGAVEVASSCFSIRLTGPCTDLDIELRSGGVDATIHAAAGSFLRLDTPVEHSEIVDERLELDDLLVVVDAGSIEIFTGDRRRSISSLTGTGVGPTTIDVATGADTDAAAHVVQYERR